MAASAAMIADLRRKIHEPTETTYTDATLTTIIERYPLLDPLLREPYQISATIPPELEANPYWEPTYDLNAAAAEVWTEKAGSKEGMFDFEMQNPVRGKYNRNQAFVNPIKMAQMYRSMRSAKTIKLRPSPAPNPLPESNASSG